MSSAAAIASAPPARAGRTLLAAGLVAGALDITYVFVYFGFRNGVAERILQGIAAALLGREAATNGGGAMVALGLALHFVVALGAAAVFYAASRKIRALLEHPWIGGALYGVMVWLAMNLVVLPLSATPPKAFPSATWVPVLIAHVLCVGWPIALITRKLSRS